jgi:hypothetical protein
MPFCSVWTPLRRRCSPASTAADGHRARGGGEGARATTPSAKRCHQLCRNYTEHAGGEPPSTLGRRGQGDDDEEEASGDFIPTANKLEFPKFDGTGEPLPWLNRCEWYFHVRRTSEHKRMAFAAFYLLDDAQLWLHHMEGAQFVQLINAHNTRNTL